MTCFLLAASVPALANPPSGPPTYVYTDDDTVLARARPGHAKEDLHAWVGAVLDSPVQAYVFLAAMPDICFFDTQAGERIGGRPGVRESRGARALEELLAQGTDPLRESVKSAHARGKLLLAGIRMSDGHHRAADKDAAESHPLFPRFALDHPEYRIRRPDGSLDVTLDYSFEEVREHRLAILREIVRTYPVDGLELDFMRHCMHFPRPATQTQVQIMNRFVQSIRSMMDEEAQRKGWPVRLVLGTRVPPTLAECPPNGLDPAYWMKEGLVDYLAPADFLWVDFGLPLTDYLEHAQGTGCRLLFPIQPWVANRRYPDTKPYRDFFSMGLSEYRALAANGYAAGAAGLHCFNLGCDWPERQKETLDALCAMASRQSIEEGPRHYQFFPSEPGETKTGATRRQTLRFMQPGETQHFRFQVAEGDRKASLSGIMSWRIFAAAPSDQWRFRLNGADMPPERIRRETRGAGAGGQQDTVLPAHGYFEIDLADLPSFAFQNTLDITPTDFMHRPDTERVMEVLEVRAIDMENSRSIKNRLPLK